MERHTNNNNNNSKKRDGKAGRRPTTSSGTKGASMDVKEGDTTTTKEEGMPRLQFAKVDPHGKSSKGRHQSAADDTFDDDDDSVVVEVGATRVKGIFSSGHIADVEEAALPPSPSLTDYAIEAHVVDESSPGLYERQELERHTRERLLRELEGAAVHADVLVEKERSCSRFACIVFCIICVMIASVTASVLVFGPSSKEGGSSSKSLSTVSPNPTQQPSLAPTLGPRNNTFCEEAHELSIGLEVDGTFYGAINASVVDCDPMYIYPSPGLWYFHRGQGLPVTVHSNEAVDIHVYLECDSVCNQEIKHFDDGRRVQWEAELDVDYIVLVSKRINGETTNQKFTLTMETNDSMENSVGPLFPGIDTIVAGSTVGTRMASDVPACGSASAPSGPGVWYSIVGNGKTITLSTCASPTALDTQISVFSNESICENGNDDYCESKSQVAWMSNVDELYYVLVHGKTGAEGTFVLQLTTEGEALADADFCANAQSLDVGSNTTIDLSGATVDPDQANCKAVSSIALGNFYRFTGTGQDVRIMLASTISSDLSSFVLFFSILTGSSCDSLDCLDWGGCTDACDVSTILGQDYYVYVYYIEDTGPPAGVISLKLLDL